MGKIKKVHMMHEKKAFQPLAQSPRVMPEGGQEEEDIFLPDCHSTSTASRETPSITIPKEVPPRRKTTWQHPHSTPAPMGSSDVSRLPQAHITEPYQGSVIRAAELQQPIPV
ncbi:hypothetical protein PR048_023389 [Dryococelus australis]|uniref:Uncharacterized protein n=1 Tax=Dryococelus australis TaxID=614101 RepID=A0ABQ9GTX9_9NEOP|nr:hypothetical protein PR048_023389 [Dryococelus australis]